ncbi:RseA family anti-sigma factor [Celerinatantimonas yamalensis]|uniref:Anti-sigma-E factor RseA n=1 Tax=Celerinatantimonas yamalensis TaxID=559956 RepID=A0ABW9G7T0_9GAMM
MLGKDEQISALMDSELKDKQMLNSLVSDSSRHMKWQRYHLMRDVIRGDAPSVLNLDLSNSIASALEFEATHQMATDCNTTNNVATLSRKYMLPDWVRNMGQYAIAASVAVIAIIGVQQYQQSAQTREASMQQPLQMLHTIPIGGTVAPVSLQTSFNQDKNKLTKQQWLEQRKEIAAYLQDHQMQQRVSN